MALFLKSPLSHRRGLRQRCGVQGQMRWQWGTSRVKDSPHICHFSRGSSSVCPRWQPAAMTTCGCGLLLSLPSASFGVSVCLIPTCPLWSLPLIFIIFFLCSYHVNSPITPYKHPICHILLWNYRSWKSLLIGWLPKRSLSLPVRSW